jgi:predicted RNase H-like HicB family nuclease
MKLKVIIHEAEEGGFWAEVPALPGCFSQGETMEEMLGNIREAIACHLDAPVPDILPERATVQEVEL